jgi:hypothetical protein
MRQNQPASLTLDRGDLILTSPFNRGLVEGIKALPYHGRQWDASRKVWRIKYMWGSDVATLVKKHLGQDIHVPAQITFRDPGPVTRMFKIRYVGSAKERDDGTQTAMGFANEEWSVIFPLKVLQSWFGQDNKPDEALSLYAILGIKYNVTQEEIKKAHRLAAKTWHPDRNRDENATEQFRLIQHAYEILSDDQMKRKYDAGLKFEKDARKHDKRHQEQITNKYGYHPPVRCGYVVCEGTESLGKFMVNSIIAWNPITNQDGLSQVSYWPKGADSFKEEFV